MTTFFVLTKFFHKKITYFVLCAKRQNLVLKKTLHETFFYLFFYRRHIKCRFSVKLGARIYSMRRIGFFLQMYETFFLNFWQPYTLNFCSNFFDILKIFFWSHEHMLRYAKLDFWTTKTTFKEEISTTFLASCLRWRRLYHFLTSSFMQI
jgi:hypothetical protein